jgi:exosortase/archaeosortase
VFIKTTTLIANENKSVYVVVFVGECVARSSTRSFLDQVFAQRSPAERVLHAALIVSCLINVLNVAAAIAVFLTFQPYHEGK